MTNYKKDAIVSRFAYFCKLANDSNLSKSLVSNGRIKENSLLTNLAYPVDHNSVHGFTGRSVLKVP